MTAGGSSLRGSLLGVAMFGSSLLVGCTVAAVDTDATDAQPMPVAVSHVHGVDVDDGRERVVIATHHGLLSVDLSAAGGPSSPPAVLGDYRGDVMSFVRVDNRFLLSGHPPAGSDEPANVGILEADLDARDWHALALSGVVDFHAMSHMTDGESSLTAGIDSATGRVMTSNDGGVSWHQGATIAARDLAIEPSITSIVATTEDGPVISNDLGQTWQSIERAPLLVLVEAGFDTDGQRRVFGVDVHGALHVSPNGLEWQSLGVLPIQPDAFGVGESGTIVIVNTQSVMKSRDGGHTWSQIADLSLPAVSVEG